uniref:Uncharacterized protein n=1 Tax=Cacopsylla melanoneura TaxID=428564 RepID=A0A8D8VAB0_9HEMI
MWSNLNIQEKTLPRVSFEPAPSVLPVRRCESGFSCSIHCREQKRVCIPLYVSSTDPDGWTNLTKKTSTLLERERQRNSRVKLLTDRVFEWVPPKFWSEFYVCLGSYNLQ